MSLLSLHEAASLRQDKVYTVVIQSMISHLSAVYSLEGGADVIAPLTNKNSGMGVDGGERREEV